MWPLNVYAYEKELYNGALVIAQKARWNTTSESMHRTQIILYVQMV